MEEPCERALAHTHGVTLASFLQRHGESLVVGLAVRDEIVGGMWFRDGEVHLAILKARHRTWARWLEPMLAPGFAAHGPLLKALVYRENKRARRFIERVGGLFVAENKLAVQYEIRKERMNYGRHHQ